MQSVRDARGTTHELWSIISMEGSQWVKLRASCGKLLKHHVVLKNRYVNGQVDCLICIGSHL